MEEEKMVKINLENENILDGFYNYLLSCGLSERTAISHYNNIDTYSFNGCSNGSISYPLVM